MNKTAAMIASTVTRPFHGREARARTPGKLPVVVLAARKGRLHTWSQRARRGLVRHQLLASFATNERGQLGVTRRKDLQMLSGTAHRGTRRAQTSARRAARSRALKALGRAGLAARGIMYILVGWIALQIAFGHAAHQANNRGAVRTVAATPVGAALVWLIAIGLLSLALWRLSQVVYGAPGPGGRKASTRLINAIKVAVYGFLGYSTLQFALGGSAPKSNNKQSVDFTAALMRHPGGELLVVVAGLVLVGAGIYLVYGAWKRTFASELRFGQASPAVRRWVVRLGVVGGVVRGAVFAAVGVFLVIAGVHAKPHQAKGLDSTLRTFAHTPLGPWLLVVVAIGLVIFGVYSCCEARWRQV